MTKIITHATNSMESIINSIENFKKGVDGIEFDVVATKDNYPIIFHDKSVQIDNGYVEISTIKKNDILKKRPDLKTLKDAFVKLRAVNIDKEFSFHIEIKTPSIEFAKNIIDITDKYCLFKNQVVFRSFHESVIIQLRRYYPKGKYCILFGNRSLFKENVDFYSTGKTSVNEINDVENIIDFMGFKPDLLSIHHSLLNKKIINGAKHNNIKLEVYTLNDIKDLNNYSVDQIVTDVPLKIISDL